MHSLRHFRMYCVTFFRVVCIKFYTCDFCYIFTLLMWFPIGRLVFKVIPEDYMQVTELFSGIRCSVFRFSFPFAIAIHYANFRIINPCHVFLSFLFDYECLLVFIIPFHFVRFDL